eukprot:8330062-Ditylum_brightwellii.AAC.1
MSINQISSKVSWVNHGGYQLLRHGSEPDVEEASGSMKPSGRSTYGMPHAVRTTEAGMQNNLRRRMLVDLILRET